MEILFLHPDDDFAVACVNRDDAETINSKMNDCMSIETNILGYIDRCNAIGNIIQQNGKQHLLDRKSIIIRFQFQCIQC